MATYKSSPGSDGSFAMDKFVPEVWSGRILKNLHDKQILAGLTTREYEGEIKGKGDTVKIHGVGNISIRDYVTNLTTGPSVTYDVGSDTEILVEVDTAKYFGFKVEDIEAAQANPKFITELSAEAAIAMAKVVDNYLYNKMHDAAIAAAGANSTDLKAGGSHSTNAGVLTLTDAAGAGGLYDDLVDVGVALDDLLCPDDGRFIILPSFAKGAILTDDRFVGAAAAGSQGMRDNGKLGNIAGFDVYTLPRSTFTSRWDSTESNAHVTGTYRALAGRRGSYAYVEQIAKVENLRLEGFFADAVRGLHLFGGGAIRPEHMLVAEIQDAATVS